MSQNYRRVGSQHTPLVGEKVIFYLGLESLGLLELFLVTGPGNVAAVHAHCAGAAGRVVQGEHILKAEKKTRRSRHSKNKRHNSFGNKAGKPVKRELAMRPQGLISCEPLLMKDSHVVCRSALLMACEDRKGKL